MTTFIGVIVGMALILAVWKSYHLKYHTLKYKYGLYSVRDKLRYAALQGKIDGSEWVFDYYDSTVSTMIRESYHFTIVRLILLSIRHAHDKHLNDFMSKVAKAEEESPFYKELRSEISQISATYLFQQHFVSFNVFVRPFLGFAKTSRKIFGFIDRAFVYPETSSTSRFAYFQ